MTSSTKPEVHRNTVKGRPSDGHKQHAQKLVKFGRAVFELCMQTDRQQTYSSQYFTLLDEVMRREAHRPV